MYVCEFVYVCCVCVYHASRDSQLALGVSCGEARSILIYGIIGLVCVPRPGLSAAPQKNLQLAPKRAVRELVIDLLLVGDENAELRDEADDVEGRRQGIADVRRVTNKAVFIKQAVRLCLVEN